MTKPWNLAPVVFNRANPLKFPATIAEIRQLAESVFADEAVISANIEAAFGKVTVNRAGEIKFA